MKLAILVSVVLKVSIILLVFSFGLDVTFQEATYLLRRAGLLLRSLLAMNVVMPLVATALVVAFDLNPAVKIALVTLSVSPVPPFLPRQGVAVGSSSFTFSLLVVEALSCFSTYTTAVPPPIRTAPRIASGFRSPAVTWAEASSVG